MTQEASGENKLNKLNKRQTSGSISRRQSSHFTSSCSAKAAGREGKGYQCWIMMAEKASPVELAWPASRWATGAAVLAMMAGVASRYHSFQLFQLSVLFGRLAKWNPCFMRCWYKDPLTGEVYVLPLTLVLLQTC